MGMAFTGRTTTIDEATAHLSEVYRLGTAVP